MGGCPADCVGGGRPAGADIRLDYVLQSADRGSC